jgi:glycerophosphoryl diester phosphodiesterase
MPRAIAWAKKEGARRVRLATGGQRIRWISATRVSGPAPRGRLAGMPGAICVMDSNRVFLISLPGHLAPLNISEQTMPLMPPNHPKPYVMAHRGNRVVCPENTLPAFERALLDGADILETDLHLSADGVFVCIHDATVDRTTNGAGAVAEKTLDELKSLRAAAGMAGFESARIPTLEEMARLLPADRALALELKTDRFLERSVAQQLAVQLQEWGVAGRSLLLSFSLERLHSLRAVAPSLPIGWITMTSIIPPAEADVVGPFWPWLAINPLYTWIAHRRRQLVCPLDPTPDGRLWLYRLLGCDAVLSDNPASTLAALNRMPRSPPPLRNR